VNAPAIRSRLLQLRRDLEAAREGRDLLDRKREAIVRALAERLPRLARQRREAARSLAAARAALVDAQDRLGRAAIASAALAQPAPVECERDEVTIASVRTARVRLAALEFRPAYGAASGCPALDRAGAEFAAALNALAALAFEDSAVRSLRRALARIARRLNGLDHIVLPQIAGEVRRIVATLEEDDRDEATRRKVGSGNAVGLSETSTA
jgi:V/A-type H+/Na+-transporting ATPase subunit D